MRGCVIVFARASGDDTLASQLVDYASRKHNCRATFAVERFTVVDFVDALMMPNGAFMRCSM
eukprot:5467368-Lingulodinium_polyedra.AAC.1